MVTNTDESWVKSTNTDESWVKPTNTDESWVKPNINDVMPSKSSVDNNGFYFTNNINLLYGWYRIRILPRLGVLNTTLCDEVCQ